jgi:hypothetical protein
MHCSPIIHAALRIPVDSAAAELAKAQSLTAAMGCTMDDSEAVAASSLIAAARQFVAAAQASQNTILGPSNWRSEVDGMDAALSALGV